MKWKKGEIKDRFRAELSLLMDSPRQGFGNTNTRNTARRAFSSAEKFGDIIDVEPDIIVRLRNILKAVNSCFKLNNEKFRTYCFETYKLLVRRYGWYTIPPSVHKLLEHGHQIAEFFDLPIGYYSGEAQESQHKEIRNARLSHSCKISRKNTMENQYHHLIV